MFVQLAQLCKVLVCVALHWPAHCPLYHQHSCNHFWSVQSFAMFWSQNQDSLNQNLNFDGLTRFCAIFGEGKCTSADFYAFCISGERRKCLPVLQPFIILSPFPSRRNRLPSFLFTSSSKFTCCSSYIVIFFRIFFRILFDPPTPSFQKSAFRVCSCFVQTRVPFRLESQDHRKGLRDIQHRDVQHLEIQYQYLTFAQYTWSSFLYYFDVCHGLLPCPPVFNPALLHYLQGLE